MPKKQTAREYLWDDDQIKAMCAEIKRSHGKHWDYVPAVLHNAIVCEMVVKAVTTSSHSSSGSAIGSRDVTDLYRRLRARLLGTESE